MLPLACRQKYLNGYGCFCKNLLDSDFLDTKEIVQKLYYREILFLKIKFEKEQIKFHGTPVDSLDRSCKSFAECLKCAKSRYGPTCQNPEFRWIKKNQNEVS